LYQLVKKINPKLSSIRIQD